MRPSSNRELRLIGLQSRLIRLNEDLFAVFQETLERNRQKLDEGDIVAVASKIISLCEGRLQKSDDASFETIVQQEADKNFDNALTIKNNIFIPFSGVDRSNAPEGYVILWPRDTQKSINEFLEAIKKQYHLQHLGGLAVDSHITPLRQGTTGLALACGGFEGASDFRGRNDLSGKPLQLTYTAVADSLASAANFLMGEADEAIPFVIIRGAGVVWSDRKMSPDELKRKPADCLFKPLYGIS